MGEEPGAFLSASLVFLLSMISSSLTIYNALLKTSKGVLSQALPSSTFCWKLSIFLLHLKTLLHKSSEWSKLVVFGPGLKFSPLEAKNTGTVHSSQP